MEKRNLIGSIAITMLITCAVILVIRGYNLFPHAPTNQSSNVTYYYYVNVNVTHHYSPSQPYDPYILTDLLYRKIHNTTPDIQYVVQEPETIYIEVPSTPTIEYVQGDPETIYVEVPSTPAIEYVYLEPETITIDVPSEPNVVLV